MPNEKEEEEEKDMDNQKTKCFINMESRTTRMTSINKMKNIKLATIIR